MPTEACIMNGRPGRRWGKSGKCYTYTPGDSKSRGEAEKKAQAQGKAIHAKDK